MENNNIFVISDNHQFVAHPEAGQFGLNAGDIDDLEKKDEMQMDSEVIADYLLATYWG